MNEQEDINKPDDIRRLVDAFYAKVRVDPLLGGIFNGVIEDRWPQHLDKMYRFWQTVLLGEATYSGSPFPPHARLPVEGAHFDRWLKLFNETVDENFCGNVADEARWRAERMAVMFRSKIEFYRNSSAKPVR